MMRYSWDPNNPKPYLKPDGRMICPYDKNHLVNGLKISSHLEKCRKNDHKARQLKGIGIDKFPCKFCPEWVFGPELIYHETHRCMKRNMRCRQEVDLNPYLSADWSSIVGHVTITDDMSAEMWRGIEPGVTRAEFIDRGTLVITDQNDGKEWMQRKSNNWAMKEAAEAYAKLHGTRKRKKSRPGQPERKTKTESPGVVKDPGTKEVLGEATTEQNGSDDDYVDCDSDGNEI